MRHKQIIQPTRPGEMITNSGDGRLTAEHIRNALAYIGNDVQIDFGSTLAGNPLRFYRFKERDSDVLQIELNEHED